MASIFLSYARDDLAKGTSIAGALEAAGHKVWWDRHIGAGARFSAEIEEALRAAERVVVLWSKASVRSAWVLDEAAAGRDSGRLIPVLIDKVEPPLGFRQYQAIDLSGRRRGGQSYKALVDAVGGSMPGATPARKRAVPWKALLIVLCGLALLAGGLWLWSIRGRGDGETIIAVAAAPSDNQQRSREFTRSIAVDLGRNRAGPAGMLTIVDGAAESAAKADYRVELGLNGIGDDLRADVSLNDRKGGRMLWSGAIAAHGRPLVDLRQEVAATVGDVLRCMAELKESGRPQKSDVESLFLNGCALQEPSEEALSIFRRITRMAPEFGPGWAGLALIESWMVPTASDGDRPVLIAAAKEHLKRAKALAPNYPDTIAADSGIRPGDAYKLRNGLAVIERGLEDHPDSALLNRRRSEFLLDAGRMRDAVASAQRASELNPLSTAMSDSYISALAYSGRSNEAFAKLREAEAIWPGSTVLQDVRFRMSLRFGDPSDALRLLDTDGPVDRDRDPANSAWRYFLEARADPTPARIERALSVFRERYERDPADVPGYLQALGTFGRTEEAYRAVAAPSAIDTLIVGSHVLFRPYMAKFRADRRFIALTAKLGLLGYWKDSGHWPDFCRDPGLPYDCKAEAAKLTPEQLRPAPAL